MHRPPHGAFVDDHPASPSEELAHLFNVGVRVVGEVQAEALFVLGSYLWGTAGAGPFLFGQPDFAAVVVKLLHRAGFLVGDGVRGHYCFDVVASFEVCFDAGAEGGRERARHGCCRLEDNSRVRWRCVGWGQLYVIGGFRSAWDVDARTGLANDGMKLKLRLSIWCMQKAWFSWR